MQTVLSGYQTKKPTVRGKRRDTRSNWVMFMFVSKCRKNVFRKQSSINACNSGFMEVGVELGTGVFELTAKVVKARCGQCVKSRHFVTAKAPELEAPEVSPLLAVLVGLGVLVVLGAGRNKQLCF